MTRFARAAVMRSNRRAKASIRVMNAAENHCAERSENMSAIEASRSTDSCLRISDLPALYATGISPRNERVARTAFAQGIWKKNETISAAVDAPIRMKSNTENAFSSRSEKE